MKVNFKVMANNSDQETNLIWDKVQNIDFFEKFNYLLSLPDHIIVTNLIKRVKLNTQSKSDYSDLFNLIKTEIYDIADYRNGINNIYLHLKNVNLSFGCFQNYNKLWNFKYFDEYRILLTLYGPGGEYSPSSGEIIMLTTKNGEFRRSSNPLETIIHEMVHIGIEECIIQKFDIPHKVKEQIVDLFVLFHFNHVLPNYNLQNFESNKIKEYIKTQNDWNNLVEVISKFDLEVGFESA